MRYFHVLPLSVHILSLSLHVMSKISQIKYSECVTMATMVVTLYMCEYSKNQLYTRTKTFPFVFVPFPFHFYSHSFHAFLFFCQFPFTSFHVPSTFVNNIFVLRSRYLISLLSFCSFMSFWCSSDFPFRSSHFPSHLPFMSLSFYSLVTSVSFPFSFKSFHFPCMSCHVLKSCRISAHIRLKYIYIYIYVCVFIVLGSFHDLPCPFMLLFSSLLLPTFYLYVNDRHNTCAGQLLNILSVRFNNLMQKNRVW